MAIRLEYGLGGVAGLAGYAAGLGSARQRQKKTP
jgi:hypothetical protein